MEFLRDLLREVQECHAQFPELQQGWVWPDRNIASLLASISMGYPVGTVMLWAGGPVRFKERLVEGAAPSSNVRPERLILDGQSTGSTLQNIEPVVNLQTLEELLTGRSAEDVTRNPRQGNILELDPDGAAIVSVTIELQQALATNDADTLRAVAQRWAETDELAGSDPDDLTDVLLQLAQLAHDANARGHALYCWLSL